MQFYLEIGHDAARKDVSEMGSEITADASKGAPKIEALGHQRVNTLESGHHSSSVIEES